MHKKLLLLGVLASFVGISLGLAKVPEYVKPMEAKRQLNTERVIGGENADLYEYPWMVSLQDTVGEYSFCGGSIIEPGWVITAGHCVEGASAASVTAVAGLVDLVNPGSTVQSIVVEEIIMHPDYNWPTNDMALLRLSGEFLMTPAVTTGNLAPDDGYQYVGDECWISGWGSSEPGGQGPGMLYMQEAQMDVQTDQECTEGYGYDVVPNNLDICARDDNYGQDSIGCYGDSGGPLNVMRDGEWIITGVYSWVEGYCRVQYPSGYTRISEYHDFIDSNVGARKK